MRGLRLEQETRHFNRLYGFFEGTVADLILRDVAATHDRLLRNRLLDTGHRPLDPKADRRYLELRDEVSHILAFDGPIELLWSAETDSLARSVPSSSSDAYNYVLLAPSLRERTDADLRFVLGHEVGHILFGHQVLRWIMQTVYPSAEAIPPFLKNEYRIWARCAELSADRAGLRAAGSTDAARRVLTELDETQQPPAADRLRCLSDPDSVDEVYASMLHRPAAGFEAELVRLLVAAGTLLGHADGTLLSMERSYILNRISRYGYAGNVLGEDGLASTADRETAEQQAARAGERLRTEFPTRVNEAFLDLAIVVVRDGVVTPEEFALLQRFGREYLGLDEGAMRELALRVFRSEYYRPFEE